jgi:hypothetical protein
MVFDQIEKLKREYTDKYVVVDAGRPDLARFRGATGRIKTINMSGRALVEFDAYNNIGWYDIALDFLKVVDQPPPKPAESHEKPAKKEAPAAGAKVAATKAAAAPAGEKKLSPIEMARAQGAAKKAGEAPKQSTADILAAARGAKAAGPAPAAPAETKKPSTADILAAARANKAAAPASAKAEAPAAKAAAEKPAASKPVSPAAPSGKLSTADILAAARANKAAAAAPKAAVAAPVVEEPAATVLEEAPDPEAAPEPVAAVEKPAAKSSGGKPSGTAEILAWCREHDAK